MAVYYFRTAFTKCVNLGCTKLGHTTLASSRPTERRDQCIILKDQGARQIKIIYSGNWKLEKTIYERYQNNTVIEWITLLKKQKNRQFISRRTASFKKNNFCGFLSGRESDPPPLLEFSAKNASFSFTCSLSAYLEYIFGYDPGHEINTYLKYTHVKQRLRGLG